jgi:hypothetical protein
VFDAPSSATGRRLMSPLVVPRRTIRCFPSVVHVSNVKFWPLPFGMAICFPEPISVSYSASLILVSVHVRDATRVRRPGRFLLRTRCTGEAGKDPAGEILQPQIEIGSGSHHDHEPLLIWRQLEGSVLSGLQEDAARLPSRVYHVSVLSKELPPR